MATRVVRKLKRNKAKENASITEKEGIPSIVTTQAFNSLTSNEEITRMKAMRMSNNANSSTKVININTMSNGNREYVHDDLVQPSKQSSSSQWGISASQQINNINVTKLIAELSENSKASKEEIENIQRKLLQQAHEFMKVNSFANSHSSPDSRLIDKRLTNTPMMIKLPIVLPRSNNLSTVLATAQVSDMNNRENVIINNDKSQNNFNDTRRCVNISIGDERSHMPVDIRDEETQLVPEKLQQTPSILQIFPLDNMGINSGQCNMHRVAMSAPDAGRGVFFSRTSSAVNRSHASSRDAPLGVTLENGATVQVSTPPAYRMPPAPEAALPGAPAPTPAPLHTHSAKFPIEREVILSSVEKNSKVPILQDARRRGRLGAVAPDTPPKALSAWTHGENNQQAGTSGDANYRQYHDPNYSYGIQNQGVIPRHHQGYDTSIKPAVPVKSASYYNQKAEPPINSQSITVTVETGKDSTRDAPKSTKSVSKTYNTIKDMISSRFKSKENIDSERGNEVEQGLNNSEERKLKPDNEPVTPRENGIRKPDKAIYGRLTPQSRPEVQFNQSVPNNMAYPSQSQHRQMIQQQIVHQQLFLNQQARSQEMLASSTPQASRPTALGADALYQQYGHPGRRSAMYQRDLDVRSLANFTSLKQTTAQVQIEKHHSRSDVRSPQQLEREIIRQRGLVEGRRAASHSHLLDEPQYKPEVNTSQIHERSRRNSHGNLLDGINLDNSHRRNGYEERESDDGGFRARLGAQGRSSFEEKHRIIEKRTSDNVYRKTPDMLNNKPEVYPKPESYRTPDSSRHRIPNKDEPSTSSQMMERNDECSSQKSSDSVYNSSGKVDAVFSTQPSSSRQTPNRIEDLKSHSKKGASGSGTSSDYDKNGGQSSNVDSGRGSVAYSSGRQPETNLHDTSVESDVLRSPIAQPQPGTSQQATGQGPENEWADMVECELRQILEPKLAGLRLDTSASSISSVTPPLPPLSPSSDVHKRNSLPARSSEYTEERRSRGRESPRWHAHKKHSSKRDHHYKKQLFGLDTTDMTSTTTRSLDLSSLLDGRTDSDASTGDARAIRRQLRGLENMYAEVLQLLGVRKPATLAKQQAWDSRISSKRRYGSMSSLPSSSVSSRPVRDKRRNADHRKKQDLKGINKRFQRLESHVVTLARSVAHLSSEMRTQHLVMQEMETIRAEISALRHMYKSQAYLRHGHSQRDDPYSFSNPDRVKRLTKFFGDEPPLMRLFLKRLGYEKYAGLLEKEKVGAAELPYVGEDKLRALGVPLGPRMRILKEAGVHQDFHHNVSRDDPHNTTTTLAIV